MNQLHAMRQRLMPFVGAAIFIVLALVGIVLLSYLFLFAVLIGAVIFVIASIRRFFFKRKIQKVQQAMQKNAPRIFEAEHFTRQDD